MTNTTKRCPSCARSLLHSSFGPDRSRPPLFLQGRCRPCTTQAKRDSRRPSTWEADLADIISRVEALAVVEVRKGSSGLHDIRVLALPALRGRGRVRRQYPADPENARHNWRDMINGSRSRLCDKTPQFATLPIAQSSVRAGPSAAP